ncbi:PTS transporter subunit EIIC, partial [Bacillus pumilus]|uniref:PTS transporter subunit EIIC n=1 Tax=Bacillus pumilus TaxID=1408 RepID=UPI001642C670
LHLTAATFMTRKYPFIIFPLPAPPLPIYHQPKPNNKNLLPPIIPSPPLTSFLTRITQPLQFSFFFLAPLLFPIHSL